MTPDGGEHPGEPRDRRAWPVRALNAVMALTMLFLLPVVAMIVGWLIIFWGLFALFSLR